MKPATKSFALSDERLDLVVDLDDERIAWKPLHEALEELDAAGFYPHRFHTVPERELARVDFELHGTIGTELSGGGGWIIERKTDVPLPPIVGCAGYRDEGEYGIAGPFSLEGELAAHRLTIMLGTLFSLRERGYRRARIFGVKAVAMPHLAPLLGGAILAEEVQLSPRVPRVVVCASGSGSNFQALIDAVASSELRLDLACLVVNRPAAFALDRAQRAGIAAKTIIWHRAEEDRAAFDARVLSTVSEAQPDIVLLLGWMHLLPPAFVAAFPQLYNIHPAYLPLQPNVDEVVMPDGSSQPAFRGARAVDDALAGGVRWIGASFHRVTDEVDRGSIIARAPLLLEPGEERTALDTRLHALEHRLVADAMKRICVTINLL